MDDDMLGLALAFFIVCAGIAMIGALVLGYIEVTRCAG